MVMERTNTRPGGAGARGSGCPAAATCLVVGLLSVVLEAAPANATNWWGATSAGYPSSCGSGNRADANPHTIYLSSYTSDIYSAHIDVIGDVISPTAVNPKVVTSRDDATDVIVISRRYVDYCDYAWEQSDGRGKQPA